MTEDVIKLLGKEDQNNKFHVALLNHAKSLVKMSRASRSKSFPDWDLQDQVYRGERYLDANDREQSRKDKPVKMVVPNTFAQCQVFASFLFALLNQNRTFFELQPTGDEDYGLKRKDCEKVLQRDLRHNQWNRLLFQNLIDTSRFGHGILETSWKKDVSRIWASPEPTAAVLNGQSVPIQLGPTWTELVKYEGNEVKAVSPYRFLPDTRFPLVEFQRGEFCATEEEYSIGQLKDMEKAGEVTGIDRIEPFRRNGLSVDLRGGETRTMGMPTGKGDFWLNGAGSDKTGKTALVTKTQLRIVPHNFEVEDGKKLGVEEFQILYHLWYANDNRIIKLEPAYNWHDQFSWAIGHYTPDMHRTVNLGLADLIYRLQDVITWHINSRITDVRRNMRGRNIIDPSGVETRSLDDEGDIYLRKSAARSGVDRWVKQLPVIDVTSGHMADADALGKIMQLVSGVNDNAMGQYNSGRRSAQESRVVTAGAAGRLKMHGSLLFETCYGELGKMMLINERQSMSMEGFQRLVGTMEDDAPQMDPTGMIPIAPGMTGEQKLAERFSAFKGTPQEVAGNDDYFVFDSTLNSEKGFMAQGLSDLLQVLLSNPQAAMQFNLDPKQVLEEMQELRDGSPVSRFSFKHRAAMGEPMPQPELVKPPAEASAV